MARTLIQGRAREFISATNSILRGVSLVKARRITWGEARHEIKRAVAVNPEVSYLKVFSDWRAGFCEIWAYGELVIVTRVDTEIDGKTLVICLMAGKLDFSDGFNLEKHLERMRRAYGCEKIKVIGRKGWERILATEGYRVHEVTLVKQCKKLFKFIHQQAATYYGTPIAWRYCDVK